MTENQAQVHLTALPSLKTLIIFHSNIDDGGLRAIRRMPELRQLIINHAPITGLGLKQIQGLHNLQRVQFFGTKVTRDEALELHATIPRCEILDSWCCGCMTIEPIHDGEAGR